LSNPERCFREPLIFFFFRLLSIVIGLVNAFDCRFFHFEPFTLIGWLPTYLRSISFKARRYSLASIKLTKPNPLVFPFLLSRITFAIRNELYFENAAERVASETSFPKSPTKIRKSSLGYSSNVLSTQVTPAEERRHTSREAIIFLVRHRDFFVAVGGSISLGSIIATGIGSVTTG